MFADDHDFADGLKARLADHPIYGALETRDDLRVFMEHHVYSVWDFMSLIKYLQHQVAPCSWPWAPVGDGAVRRFINELVLEEESDEGPGGEGFSSHFELYMGAMEEIGARTDTIRAFVDQARREGVRAALASPGLPAPSVAFSAQTFDFIATGKPHIVAAALALGREHVIPGMFRALLAKIGVSEADAPIFHYYLNRHIGLDEDFHGPLSLRLLDHFCAGDPARVEEAREAAETAVAARLTFWDGVLEAIGEVESVNE
ncbi:MAG: DUF3050 domain-containing protein [Marinibacterium sp.]